MSFLDIKDPSKRAVLVKEYVTATKTVKHRNMVNCEMKLATGDGLQTLFHPMVNATKQVAEETRKQFAQMKKTLADIDGALTAQGATDARPPLNKNADNTFGIYKKRGGQLGMGNKVTHVNGRILSVDDTEYKLTPGLFAVIAEKHPRPTQYNSNDYKAYKSLVAQTKIKSFPNMAGTARPHATWKWKHGFRKMVIAGERIVEEEGESEDTDDTDSVEPYPEPASTIPETNSGPTSIGVIGRTAPGILTPDSGMPPSPAYTRSYGKAKKTKMDREPFYKGYGVVYLPGDINGFAK